jgi:hypothetical protein
VLAAPPPKVKPPAAGAGVLAPVPPNEKPLLAAGAGDGAPKLNAMVVIFAVSEHRSAGTNNCSCDTNGACDR